MVNDEQQQRTLSGEPVYDESDDGEERTNDAGEPIDDHETKGGFNKYELKSLTQKAARRGDRELCTWSAFELTRSGFGQSFWRRARVIVIEDLRIPVEEADLPTTVETLRQHAKEWGFDSTKGIRTAMRCASLLAEAESSREMYYLAGHWEDIAEERSKALNSEGEPVSDFPVGPDLSDTEHVVRDMHTYSGQAEGRGYGHYLVTASRTSEMTDLGRAAKRQRMERRESEYGFSPDEYEIALEPIEEDYPWPEVEDRKHHTFDNVE